MSPAGAVEAGRGGPRVGRVLVFIGALLAALAAPWLLLLLPLGAAELERAEELGLISFTVRAGYPESQELPVYLWFTLAAPAALGALVAQWMRRRGRVRVATWPRWAGIAMVAALALIALDVGYVIASVPWGRFGFLAEEGVYLGTAAGLRDGGALYRDLAFSYGPLMGWPVPLALRLCGDEILGYRILVWACNLAGLTLVALSLTRLIRSPLVAIVALVAVGLLAVPVLPNLNATTLRLALGAFAVVAAGVGVTARSRPTAALIAAGAAAGLALAFSFEVGVATAVSLAAVLAIPLIQRQGLASVARPAAVLAGAAFAVLVPVALVLVIRGELTAFAVTLKTMVDLPGAGYQALPWPDLLGWFRDAAGHHRPFPPSELAYLAPGQPGHVGEVLALTWWGSGPWLVLGCGVAVATASLIRARSQDAPPLSPHAAALLGLAFFGVVVGRGAVGRSDLYHLQFYGALPAVLVGAALVDGLLRGGNPLRSPWRGTAVLLVLAALAVSLATWPPRYYAPGAGRSPASRLGLVGDDLVPLDRPRSRGIHLQPAVAREVRAVVDWAGSLPPERTVWFYPSEATYTWLTDRPPATPYPWAYDAATRAQRLELVEALGATPPDCVLVTEGTFSIDHIPGEELLPEIEDWLARSYVAASPSLPGASVLRHTALPQGACGE